jgi:hypothetical protein
VKIIEICDVNSEGHKIRLADGTYRTVPHGALKGEHELTVGSEYVEPNPAMLEAWKTDPTDPKFDDGSQPMTIEQMNSEAQVAANILSEVVKQNASSEQSTGPVLPVGGTQPEPSQS